jgi:hypothetical protein
MAFATITTSDVFPDGTSVGAYLRSQWPVEAVKGAPSGSAVATATTSAGQATFSGLADGTSYVAYASVSGAPQYRWFRTDVSSVGSDTALAPPSGGDDLAAINATISSVAAAGGGTVKGTPGSVYKISGPIVVKSNVTLNMSRCTIQFSSTSIRTNMLQNAAVTPVATATDVATTSGSAVVTSPTLAAVAQAGQVLAVVGAGPQGGNTADGANNIWLYGTVLSVAGNNITLTSSNVNGIAANNTLSNATGYLFNRASNITVIGGTWDGGTNWNTRADRTAAGFNSHQLRFRRVDGLTVRDLTVKLSGFPAGGGWVFGINPSDCTDVLVENITGQGSSTAVQCNGPIARVAIRNIRGQTQDDMVALGCVDFQGNDTEGDIIDVLVEGVFPNGSWTAFKGFAGSGSNGAQRYCVATVRTVKGTCTHGPVNLNDYSGAGAGPVEIQFEDITAVGPSTGQTINNSSTFGRIKAPSVPFTPDQAGLLLSTCDPADVAGTAVPTSGTITVAALWVPYTTVVANVMLWIKSAGATLTSGQNLAGIYDALGMMGTAGGLVAQTADQSAVWNTTGFKSTAALTAQSGYTLTLPGGPGVFYWLGILAKGTTTPGFAAKVASINLEPGRGFPYVASVPGAKHRLGFENVGGRSSLLSLNALTISDSGSVALPWVGIT